MLDLWNFLWLALKPRQKCTPKIGPLGWFSLFFLLFFFCQKKCHSLPCFHSFHMTKISMMAEFILASIRNVVLCHMVTKSLQVRPDNNQGINTALLATSMVRTGWKKRGCFSPLIFQWQGHFKLWLKNDFGWYKPVVNMAPDKASPPWGWDCPH